MKVHDIMTRDAISCETDTDLASAARIMLKGRVGTLPVVDSHRCVTGMLTDRDIAMAAGTRRRNASDIAVHEVMNSRVRACLAYDDVTSALTQMQEARMRRLPVLDATGHLAGILSIDDILLRAVGEKGGIAPADFLSAMRVICAGPSVEPEIEGDNPL
jgi:CBS-domain-containing membrane protein